MKRPRGASPTNSNEQPAPSSPPAQFGIGRPPGMGDAEYMALLDEQRPAHVELVERAWEEARRRRHRYTRGEPPVSVVQAILLEWSLADKQKGKR